MCSSYPSNDVRVQQQCVVLVLVHLYCMLVLVLVYSGGIYIYIIYVYIYTKVCGWRRPLNAAEHKTSVVAGGGHRYDACLLRYQRIWYFMTDWNMYDILSEGTIKIIAKNNWTCTHPGQAILVLRTTGIHGICIYNTKNRRCTLASKRQQNRWYIS